MKKIFYLILALPMALSMTACGETAEEVETPPAAEEPSVAAALPTPEADPDDPDFALKLTAPEWVDQDTYYELKNVPYCTNVVCEQYQYMNIYAPAEYFRGESVNGYTAETAPIVFMNNCSGWMSSKPGGVNFDYVGEGFVFVNCGARSRDAGEYGKSPCAVVDQKSAIRTLRLNADVIPGDMDRIFSVGASGGGQMSSILGASGNMDEYYPYLYESGAPGVSYDKASGVYTSTIDDSIYGCMAYCPIADINNADMAYAWMRYECGETGATQMTGGTVEFNEFKLALQKDLAIAFCEYINSLGIEDAEGNVLSFDVVNGVPDPRSGSYYERTLENMSIALNALLASCTKDDGSFSYQKSIGMGPKAQTVEYTSLEEYFASFTNLDQWLKQDADGSYQVTDLTGFLLGTGLARNKDIPGFDTFDRSAENNAFGASDEYAVHYSASVAAVLEANYDKYSALDGFDAQSVDEYIKEANREDIQLQTYLMNATHIMLNVAAGKETADFASYWRTRNGTADEHTSFSIAYNLCLAAGMAGAEGVDYSLVWDMPHSSNEGTSTGTYVEWIHSICKV